LPISKVIDIKLSHNINTKTPAILPYTAGYCVKLEMANPNTALTTTHVTTVNTAPGNICFIGIGVAQASRKTKTTISVKIISAPPPLASANNNSCPPGKKMPHICRPNTNKPNITIIETENSSISKRLSPTCWAKPRLSSKP